MHVHARISVRDFGNAGAFLGLMKCQILYRPRLIPYENTAALKRAWTSGVTSAIAESCTQPSTSCSRAALLGPQPRVPTAPLRSVRSLQHHLEGWGTRRGLCSAHRGVLGMHLPNPTPHQEQIHPATLAPKIQYKVSSFFFLLTTHSTL